MKKILIAVFLMLWGQQFLVAQKINQRIWDSKVKANVLVGPCDRKALNENEFGVYFKSEYERYQPSGTYINKLKEKVDGIDVVVIFGEWCGDSKIQVPRFMKVLDKAGLPSFNLKIYGVNRDKKGIIYDMSKYNIEKVPTFIVYQDGVELGRIVEAPKKSLERDLWNIAKKARTIKEEPEKVKQKK